MDPKTASEYVDYLRGEGLSNRTVVSYTNNMRRVERLAGSLGIHLLEATAGELATVAAETPNSMSTRRQLRTSLKHFYEFKGRTDPPLKAIRVPRAPRGRFKGLEPEEAAMLTKTALDWYPQGLAVLFGMYLALRREEIAQVRWDRFDAMLDRYTVHGKGNVFHDLPVHPVVRDRLRPTGFLWTFPGRNSGHVTPATIWNWVREVSDAAGIGLIHPHQLRHTAIATINDNTGDLRTAQEFARHSSPLTTAIYTRTTEARLRMASESLDYLNSTVD